MPTETEVLTAELSADEGRLKEVVDRYVDLTQRIEEIQQGREKVRRVLRAVAWSKNAAALQGNRHVLSVGDL